MRFQAELSLASLPSIDEFLQRVVEQAGWSEASAERLSFVGEEALSSLLQEVEQYDEGHPRRLTVTGRPLARSVELEFLSSLDGGNLENRLAYIGDQTEIPDEHEISYRLLRNCASSVRHRKHHGRDIVTVQVEGSR